MAGKIDVLEVRRDDLATTREVHEPLPHLGEGEVLLRVDRFGLTSNNVSYGVAADLVGYWRFFPAADDGWGRIPVWGFADVVESRSDSVEVGRRVFGYLPMATHLIATPTRVSQSGFTDGVAHRADLPGTYNRYQFTRADPMYRPEKENHQAVFVPLFFTSFFIDDYLADREDFGADVLILSSASSKTAAGVALCTSRREGPRPTIIGLTSAGNAEFVGRLGFYDEVCTYDEVDSLDSARHAVFVDVAGDAEVVAAVHGHFDDRLAASLRVGFTHWEAGGDDLALPGPEREMFFAPTQISKRVEEWGRKGYRDRVGAAWADLLEVADEWVHFTEVRGLDGLRDAFLEMLGGDLDPSEALMIEVGE